MRKRSERYFRSIRIGLALALGAALVSAQVPYGVGTAGMGGITPRLTCPTAAMGNPAFQLQIADGAPGALAFVALATAPDTGSFQGSTVLVDQGQILLVLPVVLDASGDGVVPLPLPTLPPSFAGG